MTVEPYLFGVPKGIRTPVTAVKGRCPRPLDDGDKKSSFKSMLLRFFVRQGELANRATLYFIKILKILLRFSAQLS